MTFVVGAVSIYVAILLSAGLSILILYMYLKALKALLKTDGQISEVQIVIDNGDIAGLFQLPSLCLLLRGRMLLDTLEIISV